MLCLTRRVGESILIGDDIEIVISQTQNGQVRLGIEAPKHIPIHRREVYERIQSEK